VVFNAITSIIRPISIIKDIPMRTFLLLPLLMLTASGAFAADTVTVDPAGVLVVTGAAPTAPSASEVRIGGGQVNVGGSVVAGNVVINRITQATAAEVVRGDDPRLGGGGYIIVEDQKPAGTGGDTSQAQVWKQRVLNTKVVDAGPAAPYCTLSANQFTLVAGTYRIQGFASSMRTAAHKARLRNITDGVTVALGSAEYANTTGNFPTHSTIDGRFTISGSKVFELQHMTQATIAGGFGMPGSSTSGEVEVYARIVLIRE
jgi:hypothetical protein